MRAPQKVEILCKGPFRILEVAPFSDFQGLISQCPPTSSSRNSQIYSTGTGQNSKMVGGGVSKRPKIEKKKPTKIVVTGCIKLPMLLCCKTGLLCEIDPTKSQNGTGYRFQNGSGRKSRLFEGPKIFWGPKNRGPLEKVRFCARDHFESINQPHFVIWQG